MDLSLIGYERKGYSSRPQLIRIASEAWCSAEMFCVSCESDRLVPTPRNTKAVDFFCPDCKEPFQLKSGARLTERIPDGAFSAMTKAIQEGKTPNLLLLKYTSSMLVESFTAIPSCFFTLSTLERRKPLSPVARRAGWIGCNILTKNIPLDGKILVINNGECRNKAQVRLEFARAKRTQKVPITERGWTLDVLHIARELNSPTFRLAELYALEHELRRLHPHNRHIRPKIRQQLQVLRDLGLVEFLGSGNYRFVEATAGT